MSARHVLLASTRKRANPAEEEEAGGAALEFAAAPDKSRSALNATANGKVSVSQEKAMGALRHWPHAEIVATATRCSDRGGQPRLLPQLGIYCWPDSLARSSGCAIWFSVPRQATLRLVPPQSPSAIHSSLADASTESTD